LTSVTEEYPAPSSFFLTSCSVSLADCGPGAVAEGAFALGLVTGGVAGAGVVGVVCAKASEDVPSSTAPSMPIVFSRVMVFSRFCEPRIEGPASNERSAAGIPPDITWPQERRCRLTLRLPRPLAIMLAVERDD